MRKFLSSLVALALVAPTHVAAQACAAAGASCGNVNGYTCCAGGTYCQPWDNAFYQCIAPPTGCGTMETNADYAGTDISSFYGLKLPQDCCDKCKENPQCEFFVFVNQWGPACYLKKGKGAKKTLIGAVVGTKTVTPTTTAPTPTTTAPTPAVCPTLQYNVDYAGNDISNQVTADIAGCCSACRANSQCQVFTYVTTTKVCYLKKAGGSASTLTNGVSGVLSTTPTPTTPTPTPTTRTPTPTTPTPSTCPTLETGIDYFGNDLTTVNNVDQAGCCSACASNSGCKAFTYVPTSRACYLKTSAAGRKAVAGTVSGVMPTQTTCPTLETGIDFFGNDIRSVTGVSQENCCSACRNEAQCKAFTYVPASQACYLKSSADGRKAVTGVVSGVITPTTPTPTTPTPIPTTPTPIPTTPTPIPTTPTPIPTTPTPTPTTPKPTPTTPAPSPLPGTCSASTEFNVDYFGGDLKSVANVDLGGCCSACNAEPKCVVFTYVYGTCYLKSTAGAKSTLAGAVSGGKLSACASTETNVDYFGGDLRQLANVDQATCCSECTASAECLAFTYVTSSRACYLKKSGYTRRTGSGLVSGAKNSGSTCVAVGGTCGGSSTCCGAPASSYCHPWSSTDYQCLARPDTCAAGLETDVDYFGNDIRTVSNIDNLADCCDACNREPTCVVFTFSKQYNSCYLKSSDAGRTPVVGNISGKKGVSPPTTTPPPTSPTPTTPTPTPVDTTWDAARCGTQKRNIFYHGNDIAGSEKAFDTVGECCDYCKATSGCKVFTYFNRYGKKRCLLKTGTTYEKSNYANSLTGYVASGVVA